MSNDTKLAVRGNGSVAISDTEDPFAAFANEGLGIVGKLLTCKKGVWYVGSEGAKAQPGALFLGLVPTTMRGYVKWVDGRIADVRMGLVADNFPMPHLDSLPDREKSKWAVVDGKPQDPWRPCYRMLLIEMAVPHGDVTFSGG